MENYKDYLTCKSVAFYDLKDEDAFFEWIKKIGHIKSFEGAGSELYLDLVDLDISDEDLRELIALFYRYNVNMQQLSVFLNEKNKEWFAKSKTFWFNKVFGASTK